MKIIAEIGINHDGLIEKAKRLIDESFQNGVHAIKFQYRNLNNTYSENAKEIGDEILSKEINRNYLSPNKLIDLSIYAKAFSRLFRSFISLLYIEINIINNIPNPIIIGIIS